VPGPAIVSCRPKAVWIDSRLERTDLPIGKIAESYRPCIACGAASGAVHEDPEKPCLERGPALETIEPTQEGEPRFLGYIFGCIIGDVYARQSDQRMVEALDKLSKCQLVARAQRSDQLRIVGRYGRSVLWLETLAHGQAAEDLASLPRPTC
jgi:hypothetical protein